MELKIGDIVQDKYHNSALIFEVMEPGLQYRVWRFNEFDTTLWFRSQIVKVNGVPVAELERGEEEAVIDWKVTAWMCANENTRLSAELGVYKLFILDLETKIRAGRDNAVRMGVVNRDNFNFGEVERFKGIQETCQTLLDKFELFKDDDND